jgi:hypothetical protein
MPTAMATRSLACPCTGCRAPSGACTSTCRWRTLQRDRCATSMSGCAPPARLEPKPGTGAGSGHPLARPRMLPEDPPPPSPPPVESATRSGVRFGLPDVERARWIGLEAANQAPQQAVPENCLLLLLLPRLLCVCRASLHRPWRPRIIHFFSFPFLRLKLWALWPQKYITYI